MEREHGNLEYLEDGDRCFKKLERHVHAYQGTSEGKACLVFLSQNGDIFLKHMGDSSCNQNKIVL